MNTLDIQFQDGIFHLSNSKVSYIMELRADTWLLHRYWGPRVA